MHSDPVAHVVLLVAVILVAGKLGGHLAVRLGQPAVLGARTHVVVPIVPRLHLGLSILSEGAIVTTFREALSPEPDRWTPDVDVGDAELDARYHV